MAAPQILFDKLLAAYGPQRWWPGDTPFEIMLGAVLTQNTSWKNVEKALTNLRDRDLLDPIKLNELPREEMEELLKPAGYFRLKTARVKNLLALLCGKYGGSLEEMFSGSLSSLREELLNLNGIGPETADAILLYAGGFPTFVVDLYTHRVLKRHGWIEPEADYEMVQDFFHSSLERDAPQFNEFHALFVKVGKEHCGKTPKCSGCPLESLLPPGGICEPEW